MMHPTNPNAVRVKRDGPRGWHWVANYDPATHELFIEPAPADPFDHDGDGKPGGSLPMSERAPPPASAEKPVPKPRAKKPRRKKGAR